MLTAVIYDKWLSGLGGGEVVACTLARVLKDNGYSVLFLSQDMVTPEKIKETLGIDLKDIPFKQVSNEADLGTFRLSDLFINTSFMDYSYGFAKKNIYYIHFPTPIRSLIFNMILSFFKFTNLHVLLPSKYNEQVEDRLRAGIFPDMEKRLDSYDTFICHSEYVKKWVKKMWSKDAIVLYPPVNLLLSSSGLTRGSSLDSRLRGNDLRKHNWIASVGRFFTLGHGKKQEVMIEAFKKLYSELTTIHYPLSTDIQLHLVGGVGTEPSSARYVKQLKEMAQGYPIFFHFNVNREEVEKILLRSKIYWHAGGYGETKPINFEHFGIAPVEAISAGCIPVLFNGGGLTEIIHVLNMDKEKYLFNSIDELVNKTANIISSSTEGNAIPPHISVFSQEAFKTKLLEVLHG